MVYELSKDLFELGICLYCDEVNKFVQDRHCLLKSIQERISQIGGSDPVRHVIPDITAKNANENTHDIVEPLEISVSRLVLCECVQNFQ